MTEGAREQQGREVSGVSRRTATWLTWSLCVLSLVLTTLSLLLLALNVSQPNVHTFDHWIENTVLAIGFSTVGAVVAPAILKTLSAGSFVWWGSYMRRFILLLSTLSTRS